MITRSASKCSEKATTEDKNLYTPRNQRTLRSSVSEKKQRSVVIETNEVPVHNIKKVNLKRSRTPVSTPKKKIRNKSPETPLEEQDTRQKTYPELPQTPIFNINIHVPPITVNSPLPGLPPIQPIICLNFDDLSKTLAGRETFIPSPENIEKSVEKLKDLFTKVTPRCNVIHGNGDNSITPVHNTNVFQCSTKNNNLNSDVSLSFNSSFNNSLRKAMKDSKTSSKQVNSLRSSKSSKKEKLNFLENDKDFMSVAPEMDGKLNALIRKELRRNLSASDLNDLKIVTKKKLKSLGVDKNISHSDSNSFKKLNLKQAVVVLENIDSKIHKNVNQELSFETFSKRISKTSSLNNSKDSVEGDFEEDSSRSSNLKLKKDVSKKSKKPEGNYSKSSTGITLSECLKNNFNVNTDQNCTGSERISKDEILRNIKRVVGNYKSGCESDSSDTETAKGTTESLNNSIKQTKVNCNSGGNENVDNRNKTDFSSTKKSFKSSEKNKINCKKSLQFDNSDLQTTKKEKGKIYSLVYESDTNDSHQKEKISSIIEGCNFSELIKKIQNSEVRKEILSLMKNSDNLNSKNPEVCNSGKNCEVNETEETLGGSENADTDNQLEKCQESNTNTGGVSEINKSNVEKNTSFCDSDESYFGDVFNKTLSNFDDLSESKEKSEKNKTNYTSNFNSKDSVTNSVAYDDDSESMSNASTILFDDGLKSCAQSKENESDDDCSDNVRSVINVGSKKKKTNESKSYGKSKNKIASKNPGSSSENDDNDTSEDEIENNEKDFSNVRSNNSCGDKETSSSEVENKRKKIETSKKPNNNKKCDEQTEKDREGKNEAESVRKNISSDNDSSNSSEEENERKNSVALKKGNTNSKFGELVKDIEVSETENGKKNISSDRDSSDTSEDETEGQNSKILQKANNNSKCSKPTEESESESTGKNVSSESDSSEDENEEKRNGNNITNNKDKKIEEERGSKTEERLSSDNEDTKKKSMVSKQLNNSKINEQIVGVGVSETKSMRKNTSSGSDSSDEEDEKIIRNILNQISNDIDKYKELFEESTEKETENTRKNNSSSGSDRSEDEDEEKMRKDLKKANNNSSKSAKEKIEAKNIRKSISSDSDSSEDKEEENTSEVLNKENNKSSEEKEKLEAENVRKSDSSDSSEDENEEKSNKATIKSNGDKGFNGKTKERKKIDENICENSDSSEDDNEEKRSPILKKANYYKNCGEKVIEEASENRRKNFSSDESEGESKKKTNYDKSLNGKFEEQKKKRFKNISERSDDSDSEGENQKESRKSLKRKGRICNENQKERRSENLIKKLTGGSFGREERNDLKETNEESNNKGVNFSESSEREDEGDKETSKSFKKLNRKERNLENVKRNIFKNDFRSENEEKSNKSPKKISKNNGCGENAEEEMEYQKYNSESRSDRNHKKGNIGEETEGGGKKSEKVNGKKRKKMEAEEEESVNDDCESENGFSGGSGGNGEGHPDGEKSGKKVKKMKEIQRSEVQTLETEIKDLSGDNNSELEEEHNLDLSEEGKVKRHAKSPKKSKKNFGKSPGKRKVQVIEKDPSHQDSPPRKKKMEKVKSKAESSSKVKSKKKMYTEDYIPLRAMGSTRFAVSNLSKIQPYQKHSALNFKKEMFFGGDVKRFKSNAEYAAYKHKQNVRNFKQ